MLALGHALLAVRAIWGKSITCDELGHLTGGYTFNVYDDYRMQPENGVLPQRWQTLPVSLVGQSYPSLDNPNWQASDVWIFGHQYLYDCGNDPDWLLRSARVMNSIFGAATVLLVGWWAWQFFGAAGALVAAVFCALCPTMLAHSALATSDMCMAFFLLAAATAYWSHLQDGRAASWLLSALVFGLACVAKYTAVLLPLIFGLLALWRSGQDEPVRFLGRTARTGPARLGLILLGTIGQGLVAVGVIWTFYGFRYAAFNPALPGGTFIFPWEMMLSFGGAKAWVITFCRQWHLLPEGWLYGLAFVLKHAEARGAFLDGQYSIHGWVEFFPKAFLYKTPPSLLAALAGAGLLLLLWARDRGWPACRRQLGRAAPLLVLFAVYWAFSLASKLNIGHRHILPTYPVLYIVAGAVGWSVARAWVRSRSTGVFMATLALALVGWHASIAGTIYPHYLAYFSPLAGGPQEGYKHLVDSSLDWGQDLSGLKTWLESNRRPAEPLYLSYFGTGNPQREGIGAVLMPSLPVFDRHRPMYWPGPGLYALSATMLQHVYQTHRGPWTSADESEYQQLRQNEALFHILHDSPGGHPELFQNLTRGQWEQLWQTYEQLRFARLCHYLRARQPDAMIGYSILVYRLTQKEIDVALYGRASELFDAMARATQPSGPGS